MRDRFPLLIQLNTRLLLRRIGGTLADIPQDMIDHLASLGAGWIYLLGVWRLGGAGPAISRADPAIVADARATLADFTPADIAGSCFAVTGFEVANEFGGNAGLAAFRRRLAARGIRLMLDFIPNHTAPDHHWVHATPDLYINGNASTLDADPRNWRRVQTGVGERILALGRDPFFDGWADTLQLDYANPETQARMTAELVGVADKCDGVRADMAMLVLPEIIQRTWGRQAPEFWSDAIARARHANPDLTFLAEVYWGMEQALLDRGFDYAYDKSFYDALVARDPARVRAALATPLQDQARMARFLENHDEPRAALIFSWPEQRAATAITFLAPGMRFLHCGQMEGAKIHVSMHLARGGDEPTDPAALAFHQALLAILPHDGGFTLLTPEPAWPGNPSHEGFVVMLWRDAPGTMLICVNVAPTRAQCRVRLDLGPGTWFLDDALGSERYHRDGAEMAASGLFLEQPAWGVNAFRIEGLPSLAQP